MSRLCSRRLNLGPLVLATVLAINLAAQQPPQPSGEAKPAASSGPRPRHLSSMPPIGAPSRAGTRNCS